MIVQGIENETMPEIVKQTLVERRKVKQCAAESVRPNR